MSYRENLIQTVLDNSVHDLWGKAVFEWEIADCIEDDSNTSACICGKENIRYLFRIRNSKNSNELFPIGSSCIKKFEREDLNELTSVKEKLFQILHAIQENKFISLNKDFFSRKLLKYLLEMGAFVPNEYNNYDEENDYEFMLDMFNKRKDPTVAQQRKIRAIIVASIKPYLEEHLKEKILKVKS